MTVQLFDYEYFSGYGNSFYGNVSDLTDYGMGYYYDWNDQASSAKTSAYYTVFWEDAGYEGRYWTVSAGEFPSLEAAGVPSNTVSSFKQYY
jgi:hypothetical protein